MRSTSSDRNPAAGRPDQLPGTCRRSWVVAERGTRAGRCATGRRGHSHRASVGSPASVEGNRWHRYRHQRARTRGRTASAAVAQNRLCCKDSGAARPASHGRDGLDSRPDRDTRSHSRPKRGHCDHQLDPSRHCQRSITNGLLRRRDQNASSRSSMTARSTLLTILRSAARRSSTSFPKNVAAVIFPA